MNQHYFPHSSDMNSRSTPKQNIHYKRDNLYTNITKINNRQQRSSLLLNSSYQFARAALHSIETSTYLRFIIDRKKIRNCKQTNTNFYNSTYIISIFHSNTFQQILHKHNNQTTSYINLKSKPHTQTHT